MIGDGSNPATLSVHKEVACQRSPVFRAAFCGPFLEGQKQTYQLENTTEGTAQFLIQWMYTEKLVIPRLSDEWKLSESYVSTDEESKEDKDLFSLWILADYLQMPSLQNYTIETIHKVSDKDGYLPMHAYPTVYSNTAEDSKLRKYICHHAIVSVKSDGFRVGGEKRVLPYAMLLDITCILCEGGRKFGEKLDLQEFFVV